MLIQAAEHTWTEVEPAIFGTLLERALNPKERAKLGAHYTPRAYVELLVGPTIIEPLRSDWAGVRVAATELIEQGKVDEARRTVETFHTRLAQTRVLDPACGTGNFLYVAMARLKELEGEVLDLLVDLGDDQYLAELTGHTITPENFLGVEINPRAAAIAQLVLWIGYLQWHFRVNGADRPPPEPILRDIRTIENRDALIEWDERVLERDASGAPVTRWDGETMKPHPVTGKAVPDEAARVEVYRYVNPRAAKWPKANFILGNPPFHGARTVRSNNDGAYIEAVRLSYPSIPDHADFVMFWWHKAAVLLERDSVRRFGFITTKSITQTFSRTVMSYHMDGPTPISLVYAIPNHPWIDESNGASVRVAFTIAGEGKSVGRLVTVGHEKPAQNGEFEVQYAEEIGVISAGFRTKVNLQKAMSLQSNARLCSVGFQLTGSGFVVDDEFVDTLTHAEKEEFIRGLIGAREIVQKAQHRRVIDACRFRTTGDLKNASSAIFQHLFTRVKPERDTNARSFVRDNWWIYGEARNTFRPALKGISQQIVTPLTAKHRIFVRLPVTTRPDSTCVMIGMGDSYYLGILSSSIHLAWALANGGRLGVGDDPRYLKAACFDPFPFPADVLGSQQDRISREAEALDALRKRVVAEHADLTLTKLYNVLEALREGRALTAAERDIHDRGLVTLIRQHHDAIDEGVADAYGWGDEHRAGTLDEEMILTRLVALNKQRATEEARGLVRYLRPEFQDPGYRAPVAGTFDLGETAVAPISNIIPWPATLPEQVGAVQSILAAAPAPLGAADIARSFKGKRAATVRPVLDALAGLGMARRLNDGRYAA